MSKLATQGDFSTLVTSGGNVGDQWPSLVRIIQDLGAIWNAIQKTGSAPADQINYLIFGDESGNYNKLRVGFHTGTNSLRFDRNTGTEAVPVWTNALSVNFSTGAVTAGAGLTLAGALDLAGGAILNPGTIDGITVSGHGSRHLPGGADALSTAAPSSIGSSNTEGAASAFSRSDHVHQGVHSIDEDSSGSPIYGDVNFVSGSGITISRSGQDITVAASAGAPARLYSSEAVTTGNLDGASDHDLTTITALVIPGTPDGVKKYRVNGCVSYSESSASASKPVSEAQVKVWVGANGNTSDTTPILTVGGFIWDNTAANNKATVAVAGFEITPAANDRIGISARCGRSGGQTFTVSGDNDSEGYRTWLEVVEIQT